MLVPCFSADTVVAEIHLGTDEPFIPAEKAHPGLVCGSLQEWERSLDALTPWATNSPGRSAKPLNDISDSM